MPPSRKPKTKTVLELVVGDRVDYRGTPATVIEVWASNTDAEQGIREPVGCVLAWTAVQHTASTVWDPDSAGYVKEIAVIRTEQRTRLVWPDVPAAKRWMKHEAVDEETRALVKPVPGCTDVCCDADAFAAELDRQIAERTFTLVR